MSHLENLFKKEAVIDDSMFARIDRAFGNDYFFGDQKEDELRTAREPQEKNIGKPDRDDINKVPWRSEVLKTSKIVQGELLAEVGDSKTLPLDVIKEFVESAFEEPREVDPTSLQGQAFGPNGLNFSLIDGNRTYKLKFDQSKGLFKVFGSVMKTSENYYEIKESDVGKATIKAFGKSWSVSDFMGRILPKDVGKRVYQRGDILQVENDEQRGRRSEKNGSRTWEKRWDRLSRELFSDDIRKDARRKTANQGVAKFEATFKTKDLVDARSVSGDYGSFGYEGTVGGDKADLANVSVDPDRGMADEFYFSGTLVLSQPLDDFGTEGQTNEEIAEDLIVEILSESLESLYGQEWSSLNIDKVELLGEWKDANRKHAIDESFPDAPREVAEALRQWYAISQQFKVLQAQYKAIEEQEKGARESLGTLMNTIGMKKARVDDLLFEYKESTRINYPYGKMWAEALKKVNKETQKVLEKMSDDMATMSPIRTVKVAPIPRDEEEDQGPIGPDYVSARRRSKLIQAGVWSTLKSWGMKLVNYLDRAIDTLEGALRDMKGERIASKSFKWGIGDEFQLMEPYKTGSLVDIVPSENMRDVAWNVKWASGGNSRINLDVFEHMTRSGAVVKTSTFEDWMTKLCSSFSYDIRSVSAGVGTQGGYVVVIKSGGEPKGFLSRSGLVDMERFADFFRTEDRAAKAGDKWLEILSEG